MHQIKLEQFEGPLDLLLQLIEQQELEITEVSLVKVTEQYVHYLNHAHHLHADELADFLVIAAKLLYIKSKALLPALEFEEEEEAGELEKQLKIYKEYLEASRKINQLIQQKNFAFAREKSPITADKIFSPPKTLTKEKMMAFFAGVVQSLKPIVEIPKTAIARTVSIAEKIRDIRDSVMQQVSTNFQKLIGSAKSKTEVVVSFLALLELIKQRAITVDQEEAFKDIRISKKEKSTV